jgi:hypothetical protein
VASPVLVAVLAVAAAVGGRALAEAGVHTAKKHKGKGLTKKAVDKEIKKLAPKLTVASALTATTATNATNAKSADTAKSSSIGSLQYVVVTHTFSGGGSTPESATATCPSGLNVTGGGARVSDEPNDYVNDSYPEGRTGWTANGVHSSATTGPTMTVTAICAPAATTGP